MGVVPDRIPRLYRLGEGALGVLGYSGAGIALASALGRELADALVDAEAPAYPLAPVAPRPLPLTRLLPRVFRHLLVPVARASDWFY